MIIKVMTRKDASFKQLIAYVNKDAADARYVLTHNFMDNEPGAIAAEFEANARLLRQHANGTVMFHDIVSITRSKSLGLERQKEILKDIARDYIARRAPDHLVYAGLHEDHAKHLHYHFIISANPVGEWRRAHLSKPQLRTLQTDIEKHVLSRYPDLEQQPTMARKARGEKVSQPGQELLRRTGKVPERQRVTGTLAAILSAAQDPTDLFEKLTDARMELYRRGKSVGVRDLETGRNHRLDSLGLSDAYKAMSSRIEAGLKSGAVTARPPPQATASPAAISPNSTVSKEEPVDILQMMLQGIGTVADALSIAPRTVEPVAQQVNSVKARVAKITKQKPKQKLPAQAMPAQAPVPPPVPLPVHTKNVRHAVNNSIDPALTPDQVRLLNDVRQTMPPDHVHVLNEVRQAMVDERLADITETRQEQDRQHNQSQDNRLKR